MKKISFILSLILLVACEDEDTNDNSLVGTWTMTDVSGGMYMIVNKSQYLKMGDVDGEISVSTYNEQGPVSSYFMTAIQVNENMDGSFISISSPNDINQPTYLSYTISDYISSLNDYDLSQLNISTMTGSYGYTNNSGNFNYVLELDSNGLYTFMVNNDTLYREIFINGEFINDSSRYAIASGTLKEVGLEILANQKTLMTDNGYLTIPTNLTLTLNSDFTGTVNETFNDMNNISDIRWYLGPDSSFGWAYCYDSSDNIDNCDGGPQFNSFNVTENILDLNMNENMCIDDIAGSGYCDELAFDMYGVEIGTLDSHWTELYISMVKNIESKESSTLNDNRTTKTGYSSIFQNIAKLKNANNTRNIE